jgi:uncharacterized protein YggE
MATVTVCGTAEATVQPDRVVVGLGLTHLAGDAAAALDAVAQRSQELEALLTAMGFARVDWTTDGVSVGEEREWRKETNVLVGYRATTGVAVTVRDHAQVGPLLRDAVTRCGADVRDLRWEVDAANPARRELLGEAARDARVRATAYAEALGLRLGEVEVVDESPIGAEPTPRPTPMMAMRSMGKIADDAEVSVSGGQIRLAAAVHVRFGMLAGK